MQVRKYEDKDIVEMVSIWNEVVEKGDAFPQEELLDEQTGADFFHLQSHCAVAQNEDGKIVGLYILHPNNIGRCGHICNASFAVSPSYRGLHIGEQLVKDCLARAKEIGFLIIQFNAVVESNIHARRLYERLGFQRLGMVSNGFRMKDGHYESIHLYYREL